MKFFVAFLALAAVAVASPYHKPIDAINNELEAVIAAINHPSTDPATAELLQSQLESILSQFAPEIGGIAVGPAIVDQEYEPISVGPAIVDGEYEPISVGPAIVEGEYEPISVGPAIVDEVIPGSVGVPPTVSSPLVQIIVNVKPGVSGAFNPNPVNVAPVGVPIDSDVFYNNA